MNEPGALLNGAIDFHVHCNPDVISRIQDITEVLADAQRANMAGLVIKEHTTSTVGRVFALNRLFPDGPRLYSSVVLNPPTGSLNPVTVQSALQAGVDVVFFPTYGARHHIDRWGLGLPPTAFPVPAPDYSGIFILDSENRCKSEVLDIVRMIADADAVLATGHLSPAESLALLRAARTAGVRRMVVTHASESVPGMSPDQQREAAALGATIEHSFFAATESCPDPIPLEAIRDQIRYVGVSHCILSSDFGQTTNGPVVEMFGHYLALLLAIGMSRDEIRTLVVENPSLVLI